MGAYVKKNPRYRDFRPKKKITVPGIFIEKKKKIPSTRIYRENFSGATRPIKTLTCVLMGGANGALGEGGV